MANERLRHAIDRAGLEPEQLAELIEVDTKTIDRWLAGRTPHPRLRRRAARALSQEEHELWPDVATAPEPVPAKGDEIHGSWAHADDVDAPVWLELLEDARERVELLDHSLLDLLATDGTTDALATKARSGCQLRILVSAPDSIWVTARAHALGQHETDYIGRSPLALEIETTRGYLEPLTHVEGIELRQLYTDPGHRILRLDEDMLISPHLHGTPCTRAPLLQLRRAHQGGLFDQFAAHLDALAADAHAIELAPELYPDPRTHRHRYQPLTAEHFEQLDEPRKRAAENPEPSARAIEQVRAEIRRPDPGSAPAQ